MSEAMELVGGPYDGETRAISERALGCTLPIIVGDNTLTPPRWAKYVKRDGVMQWQADYPTIGDSITETNPIRKAP